MKTLCVSSGGECNTSNVLERIEVTTYIIKVHLLIQETTL